MKESGNYNIEKFQTIVLFEADHQNDSKWIAKQAMKNMMDNNNEYANVMEQYGEKPKHSAIEVVLNKRLINDNLRIDKKPCIIVSNDAKSCFNQIVHSVLKICMEYLMISNNAIKMCIEVLQSMDHHVRTAFGDSKTSYKGNE